MIEEDSQCRQLAASLYLHMHRAYTEHRHKPMLYTENQTRWKLQVNNKRHHRNSTGTLNNTPLNDQKVTEEIKDKMWTLIDQNENESRMYELLQDTGKERNPWSREYLQWKSEGLQMSKLKGHLRASEQQEHANTKALEGSN